MKKPVSFVAAVAIAFSTIGPVSARTAGTGGLAGNERTPAAAQALGTGLPALPASWPSNRLEIGLVDSPGGAAALHSSGAYKFRYQCLCAGVNTGSGWSTWNDGARFADYYVDESVAAGITPVFIYYQMLQSKPGIDSLNAGTMTESQADLSNLKNATTMQAYWADWRLLMQHLGAYHSAIAIDVEPDLWGYIEQATLSTTIDDAATIPAAVASSGDADVAGLANNAAGFGQAFVRLRDKYAPNVILGYHMSTWGTNTDPIWQDTPASEIDTLADRAAAFETSLGARFDISFGDPSDRDAAFDQIINGEGSEAWWTADDYARYDRWNGRFVRESGLRIVLWQLR